MDYIRVTKENLEQEHICCAIANNKDCQVMSKKAWLAERFDEGLVFLKGDVRGKCFIEYIPAENAWVPIDAQGYLYIDCLWVSGQFKGKGYSNDLLNACIEDAKNQGKNGVVILSSPKKSAFLSDPKYMKYKGFQIADSCQASDQMTYDLLYLPFAEDAEAPKFKSHVKDPHMEEQGYVLYYTSQCPFTAKYVPVIEAVAKEQGVPFKSIHMNSAKEAQNAPAPFTTYSLFYNGAFVTNEILSDKKFLKILQSAEK